MKFLILGYGNPGRQDDGLGPALIEILEKNPVENVELDSDYQLNIEYTVDLARYDVVIFVDANLTGDEPFTFGKIEPSDNIAHTTHSMSPETLLGLTIKLLHKPLDAYLLAIRGYEFDFGEELSAKAAINLKKASDFLVDFIEKQSAC